MEQSVNQALRRIREESRAIEADTRKVIANLSDEDLRDFLDSTESDLLDCNARFFAIEEEMEKRGLQ